jgi:hypothetical protein
MARTTTRKATKAQRKFQVELRGNGDSSLLQVDACLSKLNHRLYRQGRNYRTKISFSPADLPESGNSPFPQNAGNEGIEVWSLIDTWYVHAMWKQAKRAYDRALSDEKKALAGQNLAKWRDFRVHCGLVLDLGTSTPEGIDPMLYEQVGLPGIFGVGEFDYSTVENLDTGANMQFAFGNVSPSFFDMPYEYSLTRNESASPETVITEMPYNALLAEGEDADYVELQASGNEPPYNANAFPSAIWVRVGVLGVFTSRIDNTPASDIWDQTHFVGTTGYFDAPCGMVALRSSMVDGTQTPQTKITVEVQSGNYLGVHAPVMG